jgi:NAD(P)-dependent dehydrogenase (short-subunit alcohol dehydrogenase family)
MSTPICVIVGVGEGNGAALARAFSKVEMAVALLARQSEFTAKLAATREEASPQANACQAAGDQGSTLGDTP